LNLRWEKNKQDNKLSNLHHYSPRLTQIRNLSIDQCCCFSSKGCRIWSLPKGIYFVLAIEWSHF
jgi:hypothetical protein